MCGVKGKRKTYSYVDNTECVDSFDGFLPYAWRLHSLQGLQVCAQFIYCSHVYGLAGCVQGTKRSAQGITLVAKSTSPCVPMQRSVVARLLYLSQYDGM